MSFALTSEISNWGNSLAFRVPKQVRDALGLEKGSKVKLEIRGKELIMRKEIEKESLSDQILEEAKKVNLKKLTKKINSKNKHSSVEFDSTPIGREIW